MSKVVGFSQKIKRAWLDALLDRLVKTTEAAELRSFLAEHLKRELPGKESRAKTAGIILRIWSGIPPERVSLRDRAVALLPRISGQERIWLHWGMTALAYPFFRDTAEVVGRLLALQDDFSTSHVQGRMLTTWGDRATSKEAAQKLITTLVDWEVLRSTKTKGQFLLARKMAAGTRDLELWLLEALLGASAADEIEAHQLLRLPESFPFAITVSIADLRKHEGFNIHRQGLDMDMVALRKLKPDLPSTPVTKVPKATPLKPHRSSLFDAPTLAPASSNGKTEPVPALPVTQAAVSERINADERDRIEKSIKDEVLRALSTRADQLLQGECAHRVPDDRPFAAPCAECKELFREGRHLGCIVLAQAILEAVVHHLWDARIERRSNRKGSFEKTLASLHQKHIIGDELNARLDRMWADRHAFQHLRPSTEAGQRSLTEKARETQELLSDVERQFFGFSMRGGIAVPDHPEYWFATSRHRV